jgi:hypothetical protein
MSQFDWPIPKIKLKLWRLPQNRRFYGKMECLPPWPTYMERRGGLWAKHLAIKWGAIGNTLGEHIGNLGNILGTWWQPIGNLKGTWWEQRKNEKKSSPHPHPKLKRKKIKALWVHTKPSHWLHEISIPKRVHHHFQHGLIIPPYQPGVLIGVKMVAQLFPQEFTRCY